MCPPGGGTHITRDMCFPGGGTHNTRDMCFPGRGTHSTRVLGFQGRGTNITRDMCFPGGGLSFLSTDPIVSQHIKRYILGKTELWNYKINSILSN